MSAAPRPPGPGEFADLDDEVLTRFIPGEYGKVMLSGLKDLVKHYLPKEKHEHVLGFLDWVPPDHLEEYIVRAMEYGADLTRPKTRKSSRKGNGRGG